MAAKAAEPERHSRSPCALCEERRPHYPTARLQAARDLGDRLCRLVDHVQAAV
jgi:hypothetical protein